MGINRDYSGEIQIYGYNPKKSKIHVLAKDVGFVYQNPLTQLFADTVGAEVAFRGNNFQLKDPDHEAELLINKVELSEKINVHPTNLSVGEQRRVTIISQLLSPPSVLIVDEPTTGLDKQNVDRLLKILVEYNNKGNTVILISHDLDVITSVCHRVFVFKAGKLRTQGEPSKVLIDDIEKYNLKPTFNLRLANRLKELDIKINYHDLLEYLLLDETRLK
jgi:energy-coupling factor transport system ATP-binding protein